MLCQHEFSKWITTKAATETEEGERRRVCTLCNHLEKETIPKLWVDDEGCAEHEFAEWTTTKEATKTENGERTRTCNKCGYEEKEVIPMFSSDLTTEAGCAATMATSVGSIFLTLASCVFVDKMRKNKN